METTQLFSDFENFGYSYLELSNNLYSDLIELSKVFYNQSIQKRYETISSASYGILGYVPSESELEVMPIQNFEGNRKRGYSSFDFLPDNSAILKTSSLFKMNNWISNHFRQIANDTYSLIQRIASELSEQVLYDLGIIKTNIFSNNNTLSLMRLLFYKSTQTEFISKEHTDYEFISFIISETEGLEIKNKNKEWVKVPAKQNCAILLVGDMLEVLSNGKFQSTMHRVRGSKIDRISTIFFQGLPLDYKVQYKTSHIVFDNTFGGHILPLILSGSFLPDDIKGKIAKEVSIEMTYSNPFKTNK